MSGLTRRVVLRGFGAAAAATALVDLPTASAETTAPSLNVRDYGAAGDGATDDSSAIAATIDALPQGGGSVYFPAGTYLVPNTKGLECNKSGVSFIGDRRASVLKLVKAAGKGRDLLSISSASDILIQDLVFDGSVDETTGVLSSTLRLSKVSDAMISNCRFINSPGVGVYLIDVKRVRVSGNYINRCDLSGIFLALPISNEGSFNEDVWITDNYVAHCQAAGIQGWAAIQARAAGNHRRVGILNNTVIDPEWIGISVDKIYDSKVVGNTIIKNDRPVSRVPGRHPIGTAKGECISFGGEDCVISDNYCRNDSKSLASCIILYAGPSAETSPPAVRNNHIANNRCTNANSGIDIVWSGIGGAFSNIWIQGNACYGNTYGIRSMVHLSETVGSQDNVIVSGNKLSGNKVPYSFVSNTGGISGAPTVVANEL